MASTTANASMKTHTFDVKVALVGYVRYVIQRVDGMSFI